jgi:hypothetical protein
MIAPNGNLHRQLQRCGSEMGQEPALIASHSGLEIRPIADVDAALHRNNTEFCGS